MALSVSIVSHEGQHWSGEAKHVRVPTISGSVGILSGRQPLLASLAAGEVLVNNESGEELRFQVDTGFVSVDSDVVTIVVEHGSAE